MDEGNGRTNRLKRALEEEQGAPMASRARHPSPAPAPSDDRPSPTVQDMVRLVLAVKRRFLDISQPEKYRQFLYSLVEYKHGRISMDGVLDSIKDVLHGHPDLIGHFNSLMPSALHIADD